MHLPALVAGGMLAIGDVHASMGFGEVHSGVNIDATVTIRVWHRPEPGWDRPWFETADKVMTIGVEDRLEDAIRQATQAMVALLQQRLGVSYVEAITLAGASVDIHLGQASKFGVKVSVYAAVPRGNSGIVRNQRLFPFKQDPKCIPSLLGHEPVRLGRVLERHPGSDQRLYRKPAGGH